MNELPIGLVADCRSPVSKVRRLTFARLAEGFVEPKIGAKDGLGWLPAEIEIGPRTGQRVKSISFLALDVEADAEPLKSESGKTLRDQHGDTIKRVIGPEPPDVDAMRGELSLRGWRCVLHTSYSHGGAILPEGMEHPRYRLIFDLSRPLAPAELKPLGLHVAALLGIADCVDTGALEPARLFYTPRCPTEERKRHYRHAVIEGEPLPVDDLLAEARRIEAAQKSARERRHPPASASVIEALNRQADIGRILEEQGYAPKGRRRWLWAGSTTGLPGVRLLPDDGRGERVYSSHGGDPLNDGHAHDAFDCWRILQHDGDMSAAVKGAALLLGLERPTGAGNGAQGEFGTGSGAGEEKRAGSGARRSVKDVLRRHSLTDKDVEMIDNTKFLVPNLIPQGMVSVYVAEPNGGKTVLFTHFACLIAKDVQVFYINADAAPAQLKAQQEKARESGFTILAPDMADGGGVNGLLHDLRDLANSDIDMSDVVIIVDTLKKFTDLLDKASLKGFLNLLRKLNAKGATLCLLAHANKYKDADGNLIFEGVGDLRADVDNMVYLYSSIAEPGKREVTTKPDKVRAIFAPRSFRINFSAFGVGVDELSEVLPPLTDELRTTLAAAREGIAAGQAQQGELVKYCVEATMLGINSVRVQLLKLCTMDAAPLKRKGRNGVGYRFSLTSVPQPSAVEKDAAKC